MKKSTRIVLEADRALRQAATTYASWVLSTSQNGATRANSEVALDDLRRAAIIFAAAPGAPSVPKTGEVPTKKGAGK